MKDKDPILRLRGFLALAIIWHHLGAMPLHLFGNDFTFMFWIPGRVIVWLFFVISGYSIYFGYRNQKYSFKLKDSLRFYFNRAIRILPLFYLSVILMWVTMFYVSPQELPPWQSIIRTIFILDINFKQGIFAFTPTWFIGVIIHFYILAPMLTMGFMTIRMKIGLIGTFCLLIIISFICHRLGNVLANGVDIRNIVGNVSLFLFGFFAYDLHKEGYTLKDRISRILKFKGTWLVLLCIFERVLYLYHRQSGDFWNSSFMEVVVGSLGGFLIVILLQREQVASQSENIILAMIKTLMDKAGEYSFGLYLWHGLVIVLIVNTKILIKSSPNDAPVFFLAAYFITVLISFITSILFHQIIEKPYQKLYKLP